MCKCEHHVQTEFDHKEYLCGGKHPPLIPAAWQSGRWGKQQGLTHLSAWWFIPGFLLVCKFTSCMCHPGAAEPLAWTSSRCCFNKPKQQLKAKPSWAARSAKELQSDLSPSLSSGITRQRDKQSHCEILLFTVTFVKALNFLES